MSIARSSWLLVSMLALLALLAGGACPGAADDDDTSDDDTSDDDTGDDDTGDDDTGDDDTGDDDTGDDDTSDDDTSDDDTGDDDTSDDDMSDDDTSDDDDTGDDDTSDDDTGDDDTGDDDTAAQWGTTYYVRPLGGTAAQCTGLVDADYPGNGSGQPCAFEHPFTALSPDGAAILLGGDELVIADGSYRMGYGAPETTSCSTAYPWDCVWPAIPSGPDSAHPTRIRGAGWDSGCPTRPELWGTERADWIIDLRGRSNVVVECLEITDHDTCVGYHSGAIECPTTAYPYGDYADLGVISEDSADVTLRHLDIHGFAHAGILAGRLTDWTLEDVRIAGNGWVGFDGDISGNDGNSGTTTFRRVTIEYNGCGETYPGGDPTGCWGQTAGGYGDGLGTGSTGGDWVFEECAFLHNTSDGLDLLYHDQGGTIVIERTRAEGNAGNQIKTQGQASIVNTVMVGNCGYFDGQPFTYNVDHCRALGTALSLGYGSATDITLVNSTIYSEGDCLITTEGCTAPSTLTSRNNVFLGDDDFLQPGDLSCLTWTGCGSWTFDNDFGVIDGTKHDNLCPIGPDDLCSDPLLGPLTGDTYGMIPAQGSPAIDSGLGVGGLVPAVDIAGTTRPLGGGVDRGAYEAM